MKLSSRVQSLAESATLAVTAKAAKLRSEGIDIISFGAGEPEFPTPKHIVARACQALSEGQTRYSKPASGLSELKEAVRRKLERDNRLEYSADQIIITVGGKLAYGLVLQAILDPGDEVIIPVPYWVSYPEIVKLAGGVPVFVHGDESTGFCVPPDQIRAAITDRTRALVMNSPSNPGGHLYSPEQIRGIADVVAGTNVTVLSDEIYDRLVFDDRECLSFAAASDDAYGRTVTLNSASKAYAMTGWRVGFVAGPVDLVRAIAKLQSQGTSGVPPFCQLAYAAALDQSQSCVDQMRDAFAERGAYVHKRLNDLPGIHCLPPAGAFYVFPNVRGAFDRLGVSSSGQFAETLLDNAHVAVVPGAAFGMDDHVRISFASSMEQLSAGLDRIAGLLSNAKPK